MLVHSLHFHGPSSPSRCPLSAPHVLGVLGSPPGTLLLACLGKVGIGESTCAAKWFAGPVDEDCERCNALFDISELSRVALERASTARCGAPGI